MQGEEAAQGGGANGARVGAAVGGLGEKRGGGGVSGLPCGRGAWAGVQGEERRGRLGQLSSSGGP